MGRLFFLQLYCPNGISPMGNLGCFPQGKPATTATVHAGCFSVSIIHQTLTWTTGSLTCAQMLMHVILHEVTDTCQRVCTEGLLWEKNPLPHWGIKPNLRQQRDGLML